MTGIEWKRNWLIINTLIPIGDIYQLSAEEVEVFYELEQPVYMPSITS